jgi:hypothetical protein
MPLFQGLIGGLLLISTAAWSDYGCLAEERPVCRAYIDAGDAQRAARDAACIKLPGRPVNKCPDRARSKCSTQSFLDYTYRADALPRAKSDCALQGGRFETLE